MQLVQPSRLQTGAFGHRAGVQDACSPPPRQPRLAPSRRLLAPAPRVSSAEPVTLDGSVIDHYNREMAEKMGWMRSPYEYHPELGLYYHYVTDDVMVGGQPRTPEDIDHLANREGVRAILNLQQDRDLHHWGVDIGALSARASDHGVHLIRKPAQDFDPHSLRSVLPGAVAALEQARMQHGRVYTHCTAGLGRAPAVAIAALYWLNPSDGLVSLDDAYQFVTSIRPCGPNKDAIRAATYDLLSGRHWDGFHHEPRHAFGTLSKADRTRIREKLLG